jgi:two-component system LytT family response regulator
MNIYILEDEPLNLSMIVAMIENNFNDVNIVGTSNNIDDFKTQHKSLNIDLALLDINIQGEKIFNSFDFETIDFGVVFITAYPEFAIDAFKIKAFDYLTKPINEKQLCSVITDYKKSLDASGRAVDKLSINRLLYASTDGYKFTKLTDVVYLEADRTNSVVHFTDASTILATKPLIFFESSLKDCHFYRIHHTYLINMLEIINYDKKSGELTMSNNEVIQVSSRKKPEFLKQLNLYT